MKNAQNIAGLLLLTLLVGCGDVSSNHKQGYNGGAGGGGTIQPIEGTNGDDNLRTHLHREKGAPVISYAEEIKQTHANSLNKAFYRIVPLMEKDDEGSARNVLTVDNIGRPDVACGGGTFKNIDESIHDCFKLNGEKAFWEGTRFGASGEGSWKLVSKNAENKEIWFDGRTGMVWSHFRKINDKETFNWCIASGNKQDNTNENGVDCNDLAGAESACVGLSDDGFGDKIKWRLPTRNDYLQADLNGIRFVLQKESNSGLWTSTMKAGVPGRNQAWVYHSGDGTLSSQLIATDRQVRCIGVPLRK